MRLNQTARTSILLSLSISAVMAQNATPRIVKAANAFLATLDQKQHQAVVFAFDDQEQRKRWSNFPVSMVPRSGISFKEMNPTQASAAMAMMSAVLSPHGLEKVQQIMDGDEMLKTSEGNGGGRGPGGPPAAITDEVLVARLPVARAVEVED